MKIESNPDHPHETNSNMPELVPFLLEDFKDTSEHLRTTDRKVEFIFQVIGGAITLITSIIVTLTAAILGNSSPSVNWSLLNNLLPFYVIVPMLLVWLLAWWLFEFLLKGMIQKQLYLNRLNFLRHKIYKSFRTTEIDSPAFLYTSMQPPNADIKRVGMADMFLWLIGAVLILLSVSIGQLPFLFYRASFSTEGIIVYQVVFLVFLGLVFFHLKNRWQNTIKDTKEKINKFWGAQPRNL